MQFFCTIFKITTSEERKFGQNISGQRNLAMLYYRIKGEECDKKICLIVPFALLTLCRTSQSYVPLIYAQTRKCVHDSFLLILKIPKTWFFPQILFSFACYNLGWIIWLDILYCFYAFSEDLCGCLFSHLVSYKCYHVIYMESISWCAWHLVVIISYV